MAEKKIHAVTGAFGYSGRYIAQKLLDQGHKVITLTNSPERENPFGDSLPAYRFNFDNPDLLAQTLQDVQTLYNTYWVRFNHPDFTHSQAVGNTKILFDAAQKAGVERIVHVSITNPSRDSHLEYFSGKAELEDALKETGISHAILRPTVIFGREDILINNIAWMIRRLPVVGVFGDGSYRLQPIYVEDLAELAVREGQKREDVTIDAIGPETYTFRELVEKIGETIERKPVIININPELGYWFVRFMGVVVSDQILTKPEIEGLMADLLYTDSPPAGETKLSEWMYANRKNLGREYHNEIWRRKNRKMAYVNK